MWRTWSAWNVRFEHVALLDMAVSRQPPVNPHVLKTGPVPGDASGKRQRLYLDLTFRCPPLTAQRKDTITCPVEAVVLYPV